MVKSSHRTLPANLMMGYAMVCCCGSIYWSFDMDNAFFFPILSFFCTFWCSGTVQLLFCCSTAVQLLYTQLPFNRRLRVKSTPTSCSVGCFSFVGCIIPMFPCSSMIGQGSLCSAAFLLSSAVFVHQVFDEPIFDLFCDESPSGGFLK